MQMDQLKAGRISFKEYLAIILDKKWMALLIFLLVTAATVYYAETTPPEYEAMTVLMSESSDDMPSSIFNLAIYSPKSWNYLGNLQRLMWSRNFATSVATLLSEEWNIDLDPATIQGSTNLLNPDRTEIYEIVSKADDPEMAAVISNAVTQVFIKKTSEMKTAETDRAVNYLSKQLELVDEKLRRSEQKLNAFRQQEEIITKPDVSGGGYGRSSLLSQLGGLQQELTWVQNEKDLIQGQLDSVNVLISEKKGLLAPTRETEIDRLVGSVTPQIERRQARISDWQLELLGLQDTFTDKHYKIVELKKKILDAQEQLQAEIAGLVTEQTGSIDPLSEWRSLITQATQLHVQLTGFKHREKLAVSKVDEFQKAHPDILEKEVELVRLEREARIHEKTYMVLTEKYEETLLLKEVTSQEFIIVDSAIAPKYPIKPNKMRIITMGVVLGMILGIATALFLEYMDDTVRRSEDVERLLGLPIIGSIPKIHITNSGRLALPAADEEATQDLATFGAESRKSKKRKRKHEKRMQILQGRLVTNVGSKSPVTESYRSLWTNIQFAHLDKTVKTILLTSPGPGEGKSLTTANLALTIAQSGMRVLIVDADLRRPTVHRLFGCQKSPGLSELMSGDLSNLKDFVKNTYADNLYVLTCGETPPNPVGVLGSDKMKQLIEMTKSQFDFVLFDSPPLIAMADASVLAAELDTTLLVLHAGKTKQQIANQAREMLERLNINIFGVVLNNVDYSRRYGYYYYYYQYHQYYSREEKDEVV